MTALTLTGGRVIDPRSGRDTVADITIEDGRIAETLSSNGDVIDVSGCWVVPGLVDLHGRLAPRNRSILQRAAQLQAARQNGITTLCLMPDTNPVLDSVAALEQLSRLADAAGGSRVLPIGALTAGLAGEQLSELATLSEAGCIAFSNADGSSRDLRVLARAASYASNYNLRIVVQPNDPWLAAEGCVHEGAMAHRLGLPGLPVSAETVSVSCWLELCRETGACLHFTKLSSARGVELVRQAKREGLPVSADTSLNHAVFDDSALAGFDNRFKTWPPLRSAADRDALCAALVDGTLDAICSDHNPLSVDDSLAPFQSAEAGGATFDALLPAVVALGRELGVSEGQALTWLTTGPASALQLGCGSLGPGDVADICVFDPEHTWRHEADQLHSSASHSPWQGRTLQGRVRATVQHGVYQRA